MDHKELIKCANQVMENSYSQYSHFKVGAALLLNDGEVITGTNVENASYGATICAERSAIVAAISKGYKKEDFKALAITSKMEEPTPPCALCRQVMTEFFDKDVEIYMSNENMDVIVTNIKELVPFSFTKKELKE